MKTLIAFAALLFCFNYSFSQHKEPDDLVKFKEKDHDFGKIKQGTPVTFDFEFENISNDAVEVEQVIASCGCAIVSKPVGQIVKGKLEKIKVQFNPNGTGLFSRKINVRLRGVAKPVSVNITGEVLETKVYDEYVKNNN